MIYGLLLNFEVLISADNFNCLGILDKNHPREDNVAVCAF
uniref:Uncharacterized protein n=1 Tax=Anguilla anguilla TaxID=7936 RepID=A0A0E9Q8E4_ANGAN